MASDLPSQFVEYLRQSRLLTTVDGDSDAARQGGSDRQAKLWELADLSAGEFADEAARFHGLERVALNDMMSAPPLVASFSQRYLRETMVFPYRSSDGHAVLAVADPSDMMIGAAAIAGTSWLLRRPGAGAGAGRQGCRILRSEIAAQPRPHRRHRWAARHRLHQHGRWRADCIRHDRCRSRNSSIG